MAAAPRRTPRHPRCPMVAERPVDASRRGRTHRRSPSSETRHPTVHATLQGAPDSGNETASRGWRRTRGCWYRQRTSGLVHDAVESLPVGDVDELTTTTE